MRRRKANPVTPTDSLELIVDCTYSNIGLEWIASAVPVGNELDLRAKSYFGKGKTRAEALRSLADALDSL